MAATIAVYDRRGRRLATVYLGQMPQAHQLTLSEELTAVLEEVLRDWQLPMPRLVYVTDGGYHPEQYFKDVLAKMPNPHAPGEILIWERVVDYYHACQYITKLAEALFGPTPQATIWARRMRRWLKEKPKGIHRVLHSAAAIRQLRGLAGHADDYERAYAYLSTRIDHLRYYESRQKGIPIGSGVTEAACKTIFTQRFKLSGMTWSLEGGAAILTLRVIHLSGIWNDCVARRITLRQQPHTPAQTIKPPETLKIAA